MAGHQQYFESGHNRSHNSMLERSSFLWQHEKMQGKPKRAKDSDKQTKLIVGEAIADVSFELTADGKNPAAVALGRKGGLKGGVARAESLSKQQRSMIARQGAKARWGTKEK